MAASALFEIDPGTGSYGTAGVAADAAVAVTVNCRLHSTVGVDTVTWEIFGTHGVAAPAITLSGNPVGQIASFTLGGGSGQAYGVRCKVNNGADRNTVNGDTKTSAVYVLNTEGRRPFFIGETFERDSLYGVVPTLNNISAAAAGAGGTSMVLNILDFGCTEGAAGGGDGIQDAIDFFIAHPLDYEYILIPTGSWYLTKPLLIGKSNSFVRCIIRGAGDMTFSAQTSSLSGPLLILDNADAVSQQNFVLGIQGARAVKISGVGLIGANHAPKDMEAAGAISFFNTDFSDWIDAGIRENAYSPQALLVVDPFSNGYPGAGIGDGYPYYVSGGGAGLDHYGQGMGAFIPVTSSTIEIENVFGQQGCFGMIVSPCDSANGAEIICKANSWSYCRTARASGNSQNRGINIHDEQGCIWCWYWIDSELVGTGGNSGQSPLIIDGADVGLIKYLFNCNQLSQTLTVNALYCEGVGSLGRIGTGVNSSNSGGNFTGCTFSLLDPQNNGAAALAEIPFTAQIWGLVSFESCQWNLDSANGILRFDNNAGNGKAVFRECKFFNNSIGGTVQVGFSSDDDAVIENLQIRPGGVLTYQDKPHRTRFKTKLVANGGNLQVAAGANASLGTVTTASTSDVAVGDLLRIAAGYTANNWNPTLEPTSPYDVYSPFGVVSAINPGVSFDVERIGADFPFATNISIERVRWDSTATDEEIFGCSSALKLGDAVYLSASNTVALADASDLAKMPAIGVITQKLAATSCRVTGWGEVGNSYTGLTAGAMYYVSAASPGALTATAPVAAGTSVQRAGIAKNATTLLARFGLDETVN